MRSIIGGTRFVVVGKLILYIFCPFNAVFYTFYWVECLLIVDDGAGTCHRCRPLCTQRFLWNTAWYIVNFTSNSENGKMVVLSDYALTCTPPRKHSQGWRILPDSEFTWGFLPVSWRFIKITEMPFKLTFACLQHLPRNPADWSGKVFWCRPCGRVPNLMDNAISWPVWFLWNTVWYVVNFTPKQAYLTKSPSTPNAGF
jgi:hypothetical protein